MAIGFRTVGGAHGKNYYCELGAQMLHKRQILIRQYDDNVNLSTIGQIGQFCKNKNSYAGQCCHDDISVTVLFASIAQESSDFNLWLNNWLETLPSTPKVRRILQMLDIYVETEVTMSDEEFSNFYSKASAGFGRLTYKQQGYGSLIRDVDQQNNNMSNSLLRLM